MQVLLMAALAEPAYTLPPELLAKAQTLESARTALYFGGTVWTLVMLLWLVRQRMGERIALLAERRPAQPRSGRGRPGLQGLIAAPCWLLLLALVGLPVALLSHQVSLHYQLSIEGWLAWAGDWAKSTLLTVVLGTLVLSALYAALRRGGRFAWLWCWLLTLPFVVLSVFAAPLLIDPLFNHFTPLAARDRALVAQLERVVTRGGLDIPPARMFVMDASRRYTGINAYVTGFGSSKRIVVWDTALPRSGSSAQAGQPSLSAPPGPHLPVEALPVEELLDIYGHEQGHYALGHIWKGMLYTALLLFFFYWLAARLLEASIRRKGNAWHIAENPSDWSSLGLLLLIVTALGFLSEPAANGFSRLEEQQADVYGQEVIHGLVADPQRVAVSNFNRLGRVWLEDPYPNRFVVWWSYSHPPIADRADFAAHYDPWQPGGKPRFFNH